MKPEELIQKLSGDLQPVERRPSPARLTALSFGIALACALAVLALLRKRSDLSEVVAAGPFLPSTLALAALAVLAFSTVLKLSLPGRRAGTSLAPALALGAGLIAMLVAAPFHAGLGIAAGGWECTITALALAAAPGAVLLLASRRLAPTRPGSIGVVAGIAAAALGAAALALSCPNDHPMHLLEWHILLPFAILSALGWLAGRLALRW